MKLTYEEIDWEGLTLELHPFSLPMPPVAGQPERQVLAVALSRPANSADENAIVEAA